MILTRPQHLTYEKLAAKYEGAMVDGEGTRIMWSKAPQTKGMVQVVQHLPGASVRLWVLDQDGEVVVEAGAEPE